MNNKDGNRIWELCVKQVNGSLNEVEKKELEKIEDSEETRKSLLQAQKIYLKTSNSFLIRTIDKERNWRHINQQLSQNTRVKKLFVRFAKYAAIFIVALLIGLVVPKLFNSKYDGASNRIEMEWGQMGKITLSDGTRVWLNAGTVFEYPTVFNAGERAVTLNGEAQFKVTHSDKAPFEVKTKSGIVKVYGTTFNVAAYEDDPELTVTLIEGKVTMENSRGDYLATLDPSEQIRINKLSGEATLKKVNTNFYSSWIDGKILLNETKLSELTNILKRWYNVDIQLVGNGIGDIEISGSISKGKSLDLFLKILERMYGVRYELRTYNNKQDEVIIYKK